MSMELYDAVNGDGLFDVQGKAILAITALNTVRGTTIPGVVADVVDQFELIAGMDLDFQQVVDGLSAASANFVAQGSTLAGTLRTFCQRLLAEFVDDDSSAIDQSQTAQLEYLIAQMESDTDYVTPNVVGISLSAGGSNVGDPAIAYSVVRGDGKTLENVFAESITVTVASASTTGVLTLQFAGQQSVDSLDPDWPGGSGATKRLTSSSPTESLLIGGGFDTADSAVANMPDGWIATVGTPGTHFEVTDPEIQTVAIGGTPTAGSYVLYYEDRDGNLWATQPLAYNAAGGSVQTALRELPGLSAVTVSTSGTSPNYTHTITFTGVGGNIVELTNTSYLSGGTPTITHATTNAGDVGDYSGPALKLIGDSSTLTALYYPLTGLAKERVYFCHFRALRAGACTGAVVKVAVVQEIGGAALQDGEGNDNELEIDCTALDTSTHDSEYFSFRLPQTAVSPVYLRVAITTAIPTGSTVWIDHMALLAGTELYAGGPIVAVFQGRTASNLNDTWTVTVTNNRAGDWQSWYQRIFDMNAKGLLLPSSGSNLIPDSLLA
jgi:hypothetical protein